MNIYVVGLNQLFDVQIDKVVFFFMCIAAILLISELGLHFFLIQVKESLVCSQKMI